MYAIYGNICHQYTPFMLAYIPAPWILWVIFWLPTEIQSLVIPSPVKSTQRAVNALRQLYNCG